MNPVIKPNSLKKARRRVSMRSALLLTLCACLLVTAGRIVLLFIPAAVRPLPELMLTLLAFGGGAYLGLWVLDGDHHAIVPCAALSRSQILCFSLLGVLCVSPATLLSDLWRSLFAPGVNVQYAGMAGGREAALFIVQLFKSALVVPVCEELFFRGYLLCAMLRFGRMRALTMMALCFALAHGVSVGGLVVHALLGMLLGMLLLRTHSILVPMLVHGCYNAAIVLISYSGLTPLFGRLSLLSCILRLAGCAAFAALLKTAYMHHECGNKLSLGFKLGFTKQEKVRVALALLAAALAAVLAGVLA